MTWLRPVARRASLMAPSTTSEPELPKKTVSRPAGHLLDEHLGEARDRLEVAQPVADVEEPVDLVVDRPR